MKKIISILLAVMLVVSIAAVSVNAYGNVDDFSIMSPGAAYAPTNSYTVDEKTPYSEDAVLACGGSLSDTQTIYFQAPESWANQYNTFAGPDDSEDYLHVCAYWWSGIGSSWPDGTSVAWVGYQAHLVDKANRIYSIQMPNDGGSPRVLFDNGVNGGTDADAPIRKFCAQTEDINTEGAYEDEIDTLPEGSPNEDDFNGCIIIPDPSRTGENPLSHVTTCGYDWYVYYGEGCYGLYPESSDNFSSRTDNCVNPAHHHAMRGDPNNDKSIDIDDALAIQSYCTHFPVEGTFDTDAADVDVDGYVTILDATRVQRFLAKICDLDGKKL